MDFVARAGRISAGERLREVPWHLEEMLAQGREGGGGQEGIFLVISYGFDSAQGRDKDLLFFLTEGHDYSVVEYDPETGAQLLEVADLSHPPQPQCLLIKLVKEILQLHSVERIADISVISIPPNLLEKQVMYAV